MGSSVIRGGQLVVDGKPLYILGGDVQYYRLPADQWAGRLERARDGGLNIVGSYIPWFWHEPEEGKIDFTGATGEGRNLKRFLDMAAGLGLYVIARPGPFINSELRLGGFPEWLFHKYPKTLSRRSDGRVATGRPIPAEGEPEYREQVRRWYAEVTAFLYEYDASRGGPIILFQPDNELSAAWSYGLLNSLYDPEVIKAHWPGWLRDTYKSLENLNAMYGSSHKSFSDVNPPRAFPASAREKRLCIDWLNFKRRFFAEWGATLAQWAADGGMTVPFLFNEPVAGFYGHGDHAGFGHILSKRGIEGFTACHNYADRILDIDAITAISVGVELVKSSPMGGPPMAVEVNTDWHIPRMSRSEVNFEPLLRAGFAHGLQGTVVYPYGAHISSIEDTIDGPEYYSPGFIALDGNPTWKYAAYTRFCDFVAAWHDEITQSAMVRDITIAYTPGQRLLDFLGAAPLRDRRAEAGGPGGELFDTEPVHDAGGSSPGHDWLDGYEGVSKQTVTPEAGSWKKTKEAVVLATRMNLGYEMIDLTCPNRAPGGDTLIVPCTGSMEAEAIDYLLRHIDLGGNCVFFPTLPFYDLYGNPDHRLPDKLGIQLTETVKPAGGDMLDYGLREVTFGNEAATSVGGWIFLHCFPEGSEILARHKGAPVVGVTPCAGGKVAVAGIDMEFRTLRSLELWAEVFDAMDIRPSICSEGNFHHALLRRGERGGILTVMNISGQHGPGELVIRNPAAPGEKTALSIELDPNEARCMMMGVKLGDARLAYTSSEIIPLNESRSKIAIYGHAGTAGEMAFEHPVKVMIGGVILESAPRGEYNVIGYVHEKTQIMAEMC